jgi:DNA-binding response OmpR family regulator
MYQTPPTPIFSSINTLRRLTRNGRRAAIRSVRPRDERPWGLEIPARSWQMRILIVEDDEELADALIESLTDEGYAVDLAQSGERAHELVSVNAYDLVVLDRKIPPPNGLELLRLWREADLSTPVLLLTGDCDVHDRVEGLDLGADDFLGKPFAFAELHARVRSLLRRRDKPMASRLTAGDVVMERDARRVTVGGNPVHFSPKEFALLEYLLLRKNQVVSRAELSEHVWDDSGDPDSNVIDVLIYRIRRKIDRDLNEKLLRTVLAVGYTIKGERSPDK